MVGAHGKEFLGDAWSRADCFPLLVKLLDAAEWLSLQVHPDDDRAVALEGPDACGKSEAWHVLETTGVAEVLAGFERAVDL
ncbi:MAG: Mannose-6-phosphate isomerase, partial [uncultured Thermomicrobiales bacterium]